MDVENKQKLNENDNSKNQDYYEIISKVLTVVDKVDKIKTKKKKGDKKW